MPSGKNITKQMIALHLSKRERNIVLIGSTFAIVVLLFNFVVAPMVSRFQELHQQIAAKEVKIKKNMKILKDKDRIEAEYEEYIGYMKQKTSDEQEMASLLSEVESAAQALEIRITDMKPRKVKTVEFYKGLAVELEAEGPLKQITEFIYTIQSPPHMLQVERVRLERRSARKPELKTNMLITRILIP
ncbi:type 4a pilus biogenesis protein PilO [Candidatus Omnitrophota bacterium]